MVGREKLDKAGHLPSLAGEGPLLVVSNRLPFAFHRGPRGLERRRSAGGLVSALDPVLRKRGGTWVGWPGSDLPRRHKLVESSDDPYDLRLVDLSPAEVSGFYHGFANRTLWPLFHSLPGRTRFDRRDWKTYDQVNKRFADVAAEVATEVELAWIHDYQLMRTPLYLRDRVPEARIAFFMHIPFPPYDIFRLLPWSRDLLRGLLACDLVGFHVKGYARNFLDTVERNLRVRVDHEAMLVEHGDRIVRVGAFPLGIDFNQFEDLAKAAPPRPKEDRERIVFGADRLDYTKGIPERIRSIERLLELHPEHREKVVLLQIAVPSRSQVQEYRELKREIDELVGRVNGRFATASWSPIRYLYQLFPPAKLAAMYRDADVALVTPLRDGMNLVAKEFVAAQVASPGVLVLSRLAGAMETMREALHVNPYDIDGTAAAVHRALTMDDTERRSRLAALRKRERRRDIYAWLDEFLKATRATAVDLHPPSAADFETWFGGEEFFADHHIAVFLDYDGTLAPICEHPAEAVMPAGIRAALEACVALEQIDVSIVSGRALEDVESFVSLKGVTYAGSHGMEISFPDMPLFRHEDLVYFGANCDELAAALNKTAPPGAWTERKGATLTFHYRQVVAGEQGSAAAKARSLITEAGFQTRDAHCAVEGLPPVAWDKGRAVLHILRTRFGPHWPEHARAIYVGDDKTDEDAFRVLAGLGVTIRVGRSDMPTAALRRLPNVEAVQVFLEWLAGRVSPTVDSGLGT